MWRTIVEAESFRGSLAMAVQSGLLTYTDLLRIRETRDDRLELIDGELFVTPSPSPLHQYVSGRLEFLFRQLVLSLGYGLLFSAPLDVKLAKNAVVQPDLILYLPDRRPQVTATAVVGAPSLVVEILSPSTRTYDQKTKRRLYAEHGVPENWIVDTLSHSVTVGSDPRDRKYRSERVSTDVATSVLIPDFAVDLDELFAPIPDA
jgi:Uma2 family endonuclease